jgi:hypothetical protein
MMTGHEEQLYARAEMLDETGDLAAAVTAILAGASAAGVDPRAVTGLQAAIQALDPAGGAPGYQAGSSTDRHPGSGYGSDAEFLEALSDAEHEVRERQRETADLHEQVAAALDAAERDLEQARQDLTRARLDLAAAQARPTRTPCDGCHAAKTTAVTAAEAAVAAAEDRIRDAGRRIGLCEDAAGILDALAQRLDAALARLRQVPADLGEVYELVYGFIRDGGKLPVYARFIEGEGARA